jgi:DNA-binding MarR family transcriptional regulator
MNIAPNAINPMRIDIDRRDNLFFVLAPAVSDPTLARIAYYIFSIIAPEFLRASNPVNQSRLFHTCTRKEIREKLFSIRRRALESWKKLSLYFQQSRFAGGEASAADSGKTTTKEEILEYIKNHPGSHLRQIKTKLNISMGAIQYNLGTLEKEKRILSRRRGLYKRFYLNMVFGESQRDILDVLSQETERDLLLYLIRNPDASQKQLSQYARISSGTTNWHMKRLSGSGLVSVRREGQFVRYRLELDPEEILKLLQSYHPSIWETFADRFADAIDEVAPPPEDQNDDSEVV